MYRGRQVVESALYLNMCEANRVASRGVGKSRQEGPWERRRPAGIFARSASKCRIDEVLGGCGGLGVQSTAAAVDLENQMLNDLDPFLPASRE